MHDEQVGLPYSAASASTVDHDPPELEPPFEDDEDWLQDSEEPPRRARRRLLAPTPVALLAGLMLACGFLAGVQVEKGQTTTTGASGGGGFAGPLGGGAGRAGAAAAARPGGAFPAFGGVGGAGAGLTTGEVSYVRGNTLYLSDPQGNTIRVTTTAAASVTKSVAVQARSIHPGETVVVQGTRGKDGAIAARSITVGGTRAGAGGSAGAGTSGGSSSGGATPQLFGPGG